MRQLNLALWDTPRKDICDTIQKIWYNGNSISYVVVGLAQMVRASDCGPEGRRFNSDIHPRKYRKLHASVVQRLVCKFSKLEMRVRFSPLAPNIDFFRNVCYNKRIGWWSLFLWFYTPHNKQQKINTALTVYYLATGRSKDRLRHQLLRQE